MKKQKIALNEPLGFTLFSWRETLSPALETLRFLAGATEDEFLHIGSSLQSFYQRSVDITSMASRLLEIVSGEQPHVLAERLRQIMADMERYLTGADGRGDDTLTALEKVCELLEQLTRPLEGFRKMNKTLRMLSISTKIESSRMGDLGNAFVNLALDVERLSHQVNDKSADILNHRRDLAVNINSHLKSVHSGKASQAAEVHGALGKSGAGLEELIQVAQRCSLFGTMVSRVSENVASNISEAVLSQQCHDITRQQIEHVIEALEKLRDSLTALEGGDVAGESLRMLAVEAGDVCELQEAQLRFATAELHAAVCTIVESLRGVAMQQSTMANESLALAGMADSGGSSFIEELQDGMSFVTAALARCAGSEREITVTMRDVTSTIQRITAFVEDIEYVGSEIELIALNSQIKAAHTGREGAALGVLAEAIKRLSDEAVRETESLSATLTAIHAATGNFSSGADRDGEGTGDLIGSMEVEMSGIVTALEGMNDGMFGLLTSLGENVRSLTADVEQFTARIDVHERIMSMAAGILGDLERIVSEARGIEPASSRFKQNLRHMEEHYTMESERRIHEAIARKQAGNQTGLTAPAELAAASVSDSEFGDNVDLF